MMQTLLLECHRMTWFAKPEITRLYEKGMKNRYDDWVTEHCQGGVFFRAEQDPDDHSVITTYADFEREEDALLFKLTHGGRV